MDGAWKVGYIEDATPWPTSSRPSRTGTRSHQPNRSAPSRRHATRLRLENSSPVSGSRSGSLRIRSSTGSTPTCSASSSRAHSSAKNPGASPGARQKPGEGTSRRTTQCVLKRFAAAYIVRVPVVHGSQNSFSCEVCDQATCSHAVILPSSSAPMRIRWTVGARWPEIGNISRRVSAIFTGRPVSCDAIAATTICGRAAPFEPKPPPTFALITRTCSSSRPNDAASASRTPYANWFES